MFDWRPNYYQDQRVMGHGGFRPGAGRKKGSQNRTTKYRNQVLKRLAESGYDPLAAMIEMAQDPKNSDKIRFSAAKEIASYCFPKMRSVDINIQEHKQEKLVVEIRQFNKESMPGANPKPPSLPLPQSPVPQQLPQPLSPYDRDV